MKYLQEFQMGLTGLLGIVMRFAYMKRKDPKMRLGKVVAYLVISFGILILLIIYLRNKESIWSMPLDDGTKMIISAIGSIFSEKFFTFLVDREESLFKGVVKKTTGIELKDDGTNV